MSDGAWTRLTAASVAPGEMRAVDVGKRALAVYRLDDGSWHVTDNVCTHAFALLTDGWLEGGEVECPLHAGRFDIRSGRALCSPAEENLRVYPVRVDADGVHAMLGAA